MQKVGNLHQLCVGPFGRVDLEFKYNIYIAVLSKIIVRTELSILVSAKY